MSLMPFAVTLHLLSAVVWVGGMFFAYMSLRPAAKLLEPPQRAALWLNTFKRFFPWVWMAVILLPMTGYWMIFNRYGGFATAPLFVHLMHGIGLAMIAIYMHVYFAPYRRMSRAVAQSDFQVAGRHLVRIRKSVAINMMLGLFVIIIASAGEYWG